MAVRQSAIYFHPKFIRDNDEAVGRLLIYRRDAVASILGNLYTLAGALRSAHKVPVSCVQSVALFFLSLVPRPQPPFHLLISISTC